METRLETKRGEWPNLALRQEVTKVGICRTESNLGIVVADDRSDAELAIAHCSHEVLLVSGRATSHASVRRGCFAQPLCDLLRSQPGLDYESLVGQRDVHETSCTGTRTRYCG
ncbi:MAG: hypothetical protein QOG02_619 [Gaiellales bacterium]|nr:hypothetical protein [Gaiellales bacterium]